MTCFRAEELENKARYVQGRLFGWLVNFVFLWGLVIAEVRFLTSYLSSMRCTVIYLWSATVVQCLMMRTWNGQSLGVRTPKMLRFV